MLVGLLLVIVGLALLIFGGDLLVRGATAMAQKLGVPSIIIGLTVVAFGTSTPELIVNLVAAYRGQSDIGFGNVVGSNIANIGLLLGLTALLFPLSVQRSVITREVPMMLLGTLAALVLAEDRLLTGRDMDIFNRDDGIVLLMFFGVFLYYTVFDALRQRGDILAAEADASLPKAMKTPLAALCVIGGIALLMGGGHMTVTGATTLARGLGVPEVVIGLTIVAVGTSLPELATCLVAARKGHDDLAVGNIVGSNIYNLTFIFGLTATIDPISLPAGGIIDLLVMVGFSLLLLPLAISQSRLSRPEGGLMLLGYAGYVTWLAMR